MSDFRSSASGEADYSRYVDVAEHDITHRHRASCEFDPALMALDLLLFQVAASPIILTCEAIRRHAEAGRDGGSGSWVVTGLLLEARC